MSAITLPWQLELDGLLLGPGTPYEVTKLTGLRERAPTRAADADRANAHGSHGGRDWAGPKTIGVDVDVAATPGVGFDQAVAELEARTGAVDAGDVDLWWLLPGMAAERRHTVRVRRASLDTDVGYEFGLATASLQLLALDPFSYGAQLGEDTGLPTAGGGLTYPLTYPLTYGSARAPGRVTLTNEGSAPAAPLLKVTGPLPGFELTMVETGQRQRYAEHLYPGQQVWLNSADGSVLLDGTADRRTKLVVADWFTVPPRSTRTVQFSSLGAFDAAARLQSLWAPTYW